MIRMPSEERPAASSQRPARPWLLIALLVSVSAAFAACGGGGDAGDALTDHLVLVRNEGLVELDVATGEETLLIPTPESSLLIEPAISPDGQRLVYARQLIPIVRPGEQVKVGTDLYLANRDGSDPRVIQEHQEQNEQIRTPAWLPDGERLLVNVQGISGREIFTSIQLLDLATGTRSVIVEDAFRHTVSDDGTRIAYVRQDENLVQTLFVANADGSDERLLSGPDDGFGSFSSPRFS
ncbi:MAG: hypothetical protein U1B78_04925, partial [Dehalococcoidia bacterium]|nr:hypothetical protein [Dehalococcoidia bacterium]